MTHLPNALPDRLTPERERQLRSLCNYDLREVFRELDATRAERAVWDEGLAEMERINADLLATIATLTRERDEARKVTDEMIERAAQVLWGGGATPTGYETPWRERYGAWQHDDLSALARRALTAALGGGA